MNILQLLALSPLTGDNTPAINTAVYVILGLAVVSAIALGFWKGKK